VTPGNHQQTASASPDALIALLQALVRIPSPNPGGDTRSIAGFIHETLNRPGVQIRSVAPDTKPQAVSVIGQVGQGRPVVMLHAHIDTVPVAQDEAAHWHVDPYAAVIEDGKLYGKGAIDDKAPLAAMMQVFLEVAATPAALRGTLVLVAAAEEEVGGRLGTYWMAQAGLLPTCDFIIVGEQTANRAATAHKGVMRATIRATGRSVHATNPDRGVNAITAIAHAVLALDAYHARLRERRHPQAGSPTCNVGVIQGGSTANAVPDTCMVQIDRRMIPHEDPAAVQQEIIDVIAGVDVGSGQPGGGATLTVGDFLVSNWFDSTCTGALGREFLKCIQAELQADPGPIGYLPGSDAKHLTGLLRPPAGNPSGESEKGEMVIFGPGSYEVAHAFDEYVQLDDVTQTAAILRRFMQSTLTQP
jgi:acetylornithine deacetylase/succinyl-diaminopimelate desuccinylase-like protein